MIFSPVNQDRTADAVIDQMENLILKGVLRPGDRLPAERELAEKLGVSRPILRSAIKTLEDRQLIVSRHGGGTYIADIIGTVFSPQITALIKRHPSALQDYLEYRREIETTTTALAAERATAADHATLTDIMQRMEDASLRMDVAEETAIDVDFHTAIGEAAHNIVLLHTLRGCYHLLAEGVFYSRTKLYNHPGAREKIIAQHRAIYNAVLCGDPDAARNAAQDHIDYVALTMEDIRQTGDREEIAARRFSQRTRQQNLGLPKRPAHRRKAAG